MVRRGESMYFSIIDAQSFSNSFEGVHGVVRKSGGGGGGGVPLFVFVAFL